MNLDEGVSVHCFRYLLCRMNCLVSFSQAILQVYEGSRFVEYDCHYDLFSSFHR